MKEETKTEKIAKKNSKDNLPEQLKTLQVKDWNVRQDYSSKVNQTHIGFFHAHRFVVKRVANNFNVEEAWDFIGELDFMALDILAKQ